MGTTKTCMPKKRFIEICHLVRDRAKEKGGIAGKLENMQGQCCFLGHLAYVIKDEASSTGKVTSNPEGKEARCFAEIVDKTLCLGSISSANDGRFGKHANPPRSLAMLLEELAEEKMKDDPA